MALRCIGYSWPVRIVDTDHCTVAKESMLNMLRKPENTQAKMTSSFRPTGKAGVWSSGDHNLLGLLWITAVVDEIVAWAASGNPRIVATCTIA